MQVLHTGMNVDIWTRVWTCRSQTWVSLCIVTARHRYEQGHLDTGMDMQVTDMGMTVHSDSQT